MSNEIKMSDVFELPVQNDGNVLQDKRGDRETIRVAKFTDLSSVVYATHAINNHDRLVEENKRLREFCESLQLDVSNEIKLEQLLSELDGD